MFDRDYLDSIIDKAIKNGNADVTVESQEQADALVDALTERAESVGAPHPGFCGKRGEHYRIRVFCSIP